MCFGPIIFPQGMVAIVGWSKLIQTRCEHQNIPVACSQLRSRSSSPWCAWLFFRFFSKFDDRSLDFICRHARFYLDPMCEINSKGPDPLGLLKGTRFQRGPKGGSSPWILSHSFSFQFQVRPVDFIFGRLGFWILFVSYLRLGTYLIFRCQPLSI